MKVYLAAPYAARDAMRAYADELELVGIQVTSRWLSEDGDLATATGAAVQMTDEDADVHVFKDFMDIERADVLVLITGQVATEMIGYDVPPYRLHSGGRHIETGYALAKRMPVVVVGQPENIFHRYRECTVVGDWHDALVQLCARARAEALA